MEDAANTATTNAKESRDSAESISDLKDEYEALNSKQVKSSEEQERYNELVSQIREQFPEIITYYDEATGQLQVQADLWQSMIESQKKISQGDIQESYLKNLQAANESFNLPQLQLEKAQLMPQNFEKVIKLQRLMGGNGYYGRYLDDSRWSEKWQKIICKHYRQPFESIWEIPIFFFKICLMSKVSKLILKLFLIKMRKLYWI